jgi:hypothetical protein
MPEIRGDYTQLGLLREGLQRLAEFGGARHRAAVAEPSLAAE